jgi:hypothetical protein
MFIKDFMSLTLKYKIILLTLFIIGLLFRISNYFHLGFVYDTITTQYLWSKTAVDWGFIKFWRDFQWDGTDYVPGSLYLGMILQSLNKLTLNNDFGYVLFLKIFNTISDLLLFYVLYLVAKLQSNLKGIKLFIIPTISFLMPSLAFISSVWGQYDTFTVNLSILSLLALYHSLKTSNLNYSIISGAIFAAAFAFKTQALLLLPILFIFFISHQWRLLKHFTLGFLYTISILFVVPAIVNIGRLNFTTGQIFFRANTVTNGAATFWPLIKAFPWGSDFLFNIGPLPITVSKIALIIYAIIMTLFLSLLFKKFRPNQISQITTQLKLLTPISFINLVYLMIISSSTYFLFFTKMHSRYHQFGILFILVALIFQLNSKKIYYWFIGLLIIEIGNFFNQVTVFGNNNTFPSWTVDITTKLNSLKFPIDSWLNLIGVFIIFVLIYKSMTILDNSK